jgi:serine phosphatase RsbU (regulator of sigma subunit)
VALAAIRATRRAGGALDDQARAADAAIMEQFPDARFATAVLATLDLDSGRLHYVNAGHPAPLLLREGKLVRTLEGGRRMPLGLEDPSTAAAEEMLEPGDRLLLYTDGVTDRRAPDGEEFGFQRLLRLVERELADRLPTPETLRRLCHAVIARQGTPDDDATLLLLDWSSSAAHRNVP